MIQLYRVTKYYEGVPALREVTFTVDKGEFVFVTGPSGAGKSTLLKILFCAEHADEGRIVMQGINTIRLKSSTIPYIRRNIGFVFQDYKLLPHKTISENIALALKVVGTPAGEIEQRVYHVLKKVGMETKRHLTPPKLSGGEQQKVAVARALVNEPQVLLADEPTGNLDPQSAQEVFRLFKEINMKGTTVLVATHDWETVRKMQRRIITMEGGKVIDNGSLSQHAPTLTPLNPDAGTADTVFIKKGPVKGYGLFYYIAEAFRGLRANGLVNLLAVGTISMAMLIVGFFLIVFLNLQTAVNALGDRLEMSVYLKEGLTEHEKDFIQHLIKMEPGVKKVSYLSRAEALQLFKKELKGQEALIQGLVENPLPDSYEITIDRRFADAERLEAMAGKFSKYRGVEDVSYGKEGARVLSGFYTVVTYGGMALAALLGVTVVFIISNSVRLALYSRGQEIELMQWIGATKGFIQGPFLIEGMMLAMLGSALAVGVLAGVYYALPREVFLFLSRPNGLDFLPLSVVAYMIGGGGLLGLAGGMVSVSRFLE